MVTRSRGEKLCSRIGIKTLFIVGIDIQNVTILACQEIGELGITRALAFMY